jgi:L-rhamnonate dehydratase
MKKASNIPFGSQIMKITDVVLYKLSGKWIEPPFPAGDRNAQQLDLYHAYGPDWGKSAPSTQPRPIDGIFVEIETDAGVTGLYGSLYEHQAFLIATQLRPFLIGRDALATELLLDLMLRSDRHGRAGMFVNAISAIDCALWDLKGKAWGQPVYRLLGGPTRTQVPAYASLLGFSIEPQAAAQVAEEYKAEGYRAQKWFFRYGPVHGVEGKAKNLAMAFAVREAVGPHYPLMFDAFMGWDVRYAVDLAQALEPMQPGWLEEPIPPEQVGGLQTIRQSTCVPIATGEHVHTRWQAKELLSQHAVDVLQTDPDWVGGISEQVRICALASAFSLPVIAHGHSLLPALHIAAAQSPATVPYVEYLVRHQESKQYFQQHIYRPQAGSLSLPDLPGLGMVLDETKINEKTILSF